MRLEECNIDQLIRTSIQSRLKGYFNDEKFRRDEPADYAELLRDCILYCFNPELHNPRPTRYNEFRDQINYLIHEPAYHEIGQRLSHIFHDQYLALQHAFLDKHRSELTEKEIARFASTTTQAVEDINALQRKLRGIEWLQSNASRPAPAVDRTADFVLHFFDAEEARRLVPTIPVIEAKINLMKQRDQLLQLKDKLLQSAKTMFHPLFVNEMVNFLTHEDHHPLDPSGTLLETLKLKVFFLKDAASTLDQFDLNAFERLTLCRDTPELRTVLSQNVKRRIEQIEESQDKCRQWTDLSKRCSIDIKEYEDLIALEKKNMINTRNKAMISLIPVAAVMILIPASHTLFSVALLIAAIPLIYYAVLMVFNQIFDNTESLQRSINSTRNHSNNLKRYSERAKKSLDQQIDDFNREKFQPESFLSKTDQILKEYRKEWDKVIEERGEILQDFTSKSHALNRQYSLWKAIPVEQIAASLTPATPSAP